MHLHSVLRVVEPLLICVQLYELGLVFHCHLGRANAAHRLPRPLSGDGVLLPGVGKHLADVETIEVMVPVGVLHPPSPVTFLAFEHQVQLLSQIPMFVPLL